MTTCSSELVLLASSTAVVRASSASSEPSVASRIFVGKMLNSASLPSGSFPPSGSQAGLVSPAMLHLTLRLWQQRMKLSSSGGRVASIYLSIHLINNRDCMKKSHERTSHLTMRRLMAPYTGALRRMYLAPRLESLQVLQSTGCLPNLLGQCG